MGASDTDVVQMVKLERTLSGLEDAENLMVQSEYVCEIGRGSFGFVELRQHLRTGEEYAVKRNISIEVDSKIRRDAEHELAMLEYIRLKTRFPGTKVPITDYLMLPIAVGQERTTGLPYYIFPAAENNLEEYWMHNYVLTKAIFMPEEEVVEVLCHVVSGLRCLHAAGVTHNDIKPDNILVKELNNGKRNFMLADFGLAAKYKEGQHRLGNRSAAAPELLMRSCPETPEEEMWKCHPGSDIWSVGILAVVLITNEWPFEPVSIPGEPNDCTLLQMQLELLVDSDALCDKLLTGRHVHPQLISAVMDCLSFHPAHRPTAEDLLMRLRRTQATLKRNARLQGLRSSAVVPTKASHNLFVPTSSTATSHSSEAFTEEAAPDTSLTAKHSSSLSLTASSDASVILQAQRPAAATTATQCASCVKTDILSAGATSSSSTISTTTTATGTVMDVANEQNMSSTQVKIMSSASPSQATVVPSLTSTVTTATTPVTALAMSTATIGMPQALMAPVSSGLPMHLAPVNPVFTVTDALYETQMGATRQQPDGCSNVPSIVAAPCVACC